MEWEGGPQAPVEDSAGASAADPIS